MSKRHLSFYQIKPIDNSYRVKFEQIEELSLSHAILLETARFPCPDEAKQIKIDKGEIVKFSSQNTFENRFKVITGQHKGKVFVLKSFNAKKNFVFPHFYLKPKYRMKQGEVLIDWTQYNPNCPNGQLKYNFTAELKDEEKESASNHSDLCLEFFPGKHLECVVLTSYTESPLCKTALEFAFQACWFSHTDREEDVRHEIYGQNGAFQQIKSFDNVLIYIFITNADVNLNRVPPQECVGKCGKQNSSSCLACGTCKKVDVKHVQIWVPQELPVSKIKGGHLWYAATNPNATKNGLTWMGENMVQTLNRDWKFFTQIAANCESKLIGNALKRGYHPFGDGDKSKALVKLFGVEEEEDLAHLINVTNRWTNSGYPLLAPLQFKGRILPPEND